MSLWKYNDVELDVDMADAEFQEKYENAFEKMEKSEKTMKKDGKISEITRAYCSLYTNLFDDIFGKGTSEKLLMEELILNSVRLVMILLLVFAAVKLQRLIRKGHRCYPSTV